jgi:hypothetical protein
MGNFVARVRKVLSRLTGMNFQNFDHGVAQKYEKDYAEQWLKENFVKLYPNITDRSLQKSVVSEEFFENREEWDRFVQHIEGKTCLEIGSGPAGAIVRWYWAGKRIIIDPLAGEYKRASLSLFNKSWFTDDMELISSPAEEVVPNLVGRVDGAVVCRNVIDHCVRPMDVVVAIAKYASPGCYLLIWNDLWHTKGHDEGHTNITKDVEAYKADLVKLGFRIDYSFNVEGRGTINYGCRAVKI